MIEIREITAAGKDVQEAQENARAMLGVDELADVKFEVLHTGSRGIFGIIGVKPAQVRAYIEIEVPDKEERRPRREKQSRNAAPVESEATESVEASGEETPKKKKPRRRRKNKRESAPVIPTEFETVSKPKSEVIPEAELYSCEDGTRRIAIKGEDASVLIGHHGDTLDALQYLANLVSTTKKNKDGERDKSRVTIDIEGYRAKREETLRALARRMAAKALRNKRSVMLEPMSAYERRIIHSEVQGIEGVSTNSIGSDNSRRIVIYLSDKKPEGIFEENVETEVSSEE